MSYILDALKRSEQERHQDKMPSFSAENMIIQTNQKKAHWWPFVLILVLILNAIILFIYKSDIFNPNNEPLATNPHRSHDVQTEIPSVKIASPTVNEINKRRAPPSNVIEKRNSNQDDIQFNVEAFTLEMGSQEVINFDEGRVDAISILSYLNQKGVLLNSDFSPAEMVRLGVYLKDYKTLYTDFGGMVEYIAKPGQKVKKGEALAQVLNIDELDLKIILDELVLK